MEHLADELKAIFDGYDQRRDAFGKALYAALFGFVSVLFLVQQSELMPLIDRLFLPGFNALLPWYVPWLLALLSFVLRSASTHRWLYRRFIEPQPTLADLMVGHQSPPLPKSTPPGIDPTATPLPAHPARRFVPRKVLRRA